MSGANSIYLPEAKAEQIKDGIGDGALKNTKSLGDIPAIEIRTTGPRNQQIVGEDPIVDSESLHSEPHSEPVLANHDVNLVSSLQRRGGTTVSDDDVQSISKGWRHLRNAVKVTTAVSMKKRTVVTREDSFLKKFSTRQPYRADSEANLNDKYDVDQKPEDIPKVPLIFRVDGNLMWYWLGVVTVAVLYNLWTCIAREAFREIQEDYHIMWLIMDAFCDFIYVLDIVCQFRTGYLDQGILVYDAKKLAKKYISSRSFILDLLSLLPLDLIQIGIGMHPMLRFPRFIKVYRSFRFIYMMESRTAFPNFFRVANLTHILFLGSHWFAAFYYLISEAENFEGSWSYPKPVGEFSSVTRKYLASLFWSTLTLTTIGDLPPPETNWEYVFVIVSYLIGVFIFATIVGQVGNVITNRNASRQEFERLLDGAKMYMRTHNVPPELQKRVQRWYDYVWKRGRMKGSDINSLGMLPDKFKTELAIHVNLETLKKVTIFQECQPEFLHDLVLKMRAYIFTPGDLICRRGEIAREMFIIADGRVEIISESGTVLTQMGTGDFFGEIGILNLDGGINRRTADVKSVGYSELFGLSREDVLEALKDHPDAELIIRNYGQKRLKEIEKHRKINKAPPSVWSPNSPCKGLRSMIATANRGSANRGPLPGLNLSEAEADVGERPCKNRRTSFLNNVRKFIGESRFNRGKYDRSLRSNRSVHPTHSTNIFSMANTFPMRGSTKRNGIKINSLSANHSPPPTSESVEAPLLDIKCTTRESSGKNDDTLLTPGSVLPKSTVTFRGHSNSFSSIRSKDFNNFLYPTRKAQSCVEPIPSPQHLSIHPTEPCFSGQRAYPDIEANVNDNNEEDGYIPPYKDYSKVVQGVAKLPRKFRLPDKYHSPEDDITPLPSPLNSRSASPMVSRRSDEHSFQCCCTKLTSDMKSLEQRMTSMEQAYKESLQRLGAISSQQTVLVASMQQILQIQGIHPQGKKQETKADEPFNKQTKL